MTDKALIQSKLRENSQTLDILSTEQLITMWEKSTGRDIAQYLTDTARTASNYVAPAIDSIVAAKLIKDLGFTGKVVIKKVNGKDYVIFKGYPGTRSLFTGTRYLANNPQVVDMAIGRMGVNQSVISGARLTIFLVVPLNILRFILEDQQTMLELIGNTASDLVKVGVASSLAGLAGTAVAATTTLAAGPLIVAIVVGVAAGLALDALDRQFGVTDKLIEALENGYDNSVGAFGRAINRLENTLRWQALHGVPVGKGIFYP